jgi:serine/threonine-protein kinase
VVHRDIKPANILLTASGELKLCDFGIARDAAAVGHTLTGVGNVVGTPAYMSPEHARGEAVGPRSDLYALGCVLYELLTGAPPFRGEGWQVLGQHASREPAPVRELRADVPAPLDALVAALLTKQPRQRPASAAEVAERLRGTAATAAKTTLDAGAAGTPALPSAVGRPSGGTGVAGRAGVLDTVVVGGQLALFSPLPLPAAAALGIVAGGVIAAGYALEARQEAAGAASPEALPLSAVGVLLALVIAAAVMVGLLAGSPAPWWAAVLAGMVTGPVLVGCAAAVRAAVELCVVRGAPHADAACTAGMLSAVVAAALTATGAHVPVLVALLAGAGTWAVIAGAAAVVLPGPRAVRP